MATEVPAAGVTAGGERRLTVEHLTARALVESATFADAVRRILGAICSALGWEHGALWRIDHEASVLRCAEIWSPSSVAFPEFDDASRSTEFPRGVGLPGRVWATGEPAWIPDVAQDTNFPRAAIAAREGLHAAFGFPVLLRGEVLNVMEFFSREIRPPDEDLLSMFGSVGNQIGLFMDRRRAQEELDRFFTLSLDMLCVASFDGYFKRVNPAWGRVLGYTEEELLSRPYIEFVHPEDRQPTSTESRKLAQGRDVTYFENRYLHKVGTIRWLLWTSTPFPELQVVYAAARDITERKAAEETMSEYARDLEATHRELETQAAQLAQLVKELEVSKARAEEAAEAKSAFLANMSHEIRTPLNAIVGMTTLALQTRLTNEQRDYLATVKSSADSLLAVVNDILDFSKIEAHRVELEHAEFELRETVGDAAKLLGVRAGEKKIELAWHI
jgi:two-component system sensor histidine kinase/response regulator